MRIIPIVVTLVASALIAAPAASVAQGNGNKGATDSQKRAQVERSQRDLDRDRLRTQDRLGDTQQDRDRIQDRTNAPDDAKQAQIYGYQLMDDAERKAYRERIMNANSAEERHRIEAQHREEIQVRARNRNIKIDDKGDPIPED
jgi:hypothetical protein